MKKRLPAIAAFALALPMLPACQSDSTPEDHSAARDAARDQQMREFLAEQQRAAATQRAVGSSMPTR